MSSAIARTSQTARVQIAARAPARDASPDIHRQTPVDSFERSGGPGRTAIQTAGPAVGAPAGVAASSRWSQVQGARRRSRPSPAPPSADQQKALLVSDAFQEKVMDAFFSRYPQHAALRGVPSTQWDAAVINDYERVQAAVFTKTTGVAPDPVAWSELVEERRAAGLLPEGFHSIYEYMASDPAHRPAGAVPALNDAIAEFGSGGRSPSVDDIVEFWLRLGVNPFDLLSASRSMMGLVQYAGNRDYPSSFTVDGPYSFHWLQGDDGQVAQFRVEYALDS